MASNIVEDEPDTVNDFDHLLELWARKWAEEHKTKLEWIDYQGTRFQLQTAGIFHPRRGDGLDPATYKLRLKCGVIKQSDFGEQSVTDRDVVTGITETQRNDGTVSSSFTFNKTIEHTTQTRISVSWTGVLKVGLTVEFGFPPFTRASGNVALEVTKNKLEEKTEGEKKSWAISQQTTCAPKRITKVTAVITERQAKSVFQKEITLSGYVVVRCKKPTTYPQCAVRKGKHCKWPVPVRLVFEELKNYSGSPADAAFVQEHIKQYAIKGDHVVCSLRVEVETQQGIRCDAVTSSEIPADEIKHSPEDLRKQLVDSYKQELKIERLFFPSLPLEHFVNLSVLNTADYQTQLDSLATKARRGLSYDESLDGVTHLYGQEGGYVRPITEFLKLLAKKKNKVLITGTAGIGKSVLSKHLVHLWAQGKCGEQFSWVFRVPLRNLLQTTGDCRPIHVIRACLEEELAGLNGSFTEGDLLTLEKEITEQINLCKVLFILDGYDEIVETLPERLENVFKALLDSPHVLLTSRPYNLQSLETKYHFMKTLHWEVTGFTPSDVNVYIRNFFTHLEHPKPEKAESLTHFIAQNLNVSGACRIPINLELICSAWHEQELRQQVVSTYSLYHAVVISLCMRQLQRSGLKVSNLDHDLVLLNFKQQLGFLDFVAFQSLVENQLFFPISKARRYVLSLGGLEEKGSDILIEDQNCLGFIKPNNPGGAYDGGSPFYFNHLTFRDYFAARYIADCLQQIVVRPPAAGASNHFFHKWQDFDNPALDTVASFIAQNKFESSFELVAWFVTGYLANHEDIRSLEYFFKLLFAGAVRDCSGFFEFLLLIRCVDEAHLVIHKFHKDFRAAVFKYITDWLSFLVTSWGIDRNPAITRLALSQNLSAMKEMQDFFTGLIIQAEPKDLYRIITFLTRIRAVNCTLMELVKKTSSIVETQSIWSVALQSHTIDQTELLLEKLATLAPNPSLSLLEILVVREVLSNTLARIQNPSVAEISSLFEMPFVQAKLTMLQNIVTETETPEAIRIAAANALGQVLSSIKRYSQDGSLSFHNIDSLSALPFLASTSTILQDLAGATSASELVRKAAVTALGQILLLAKIDNPSLDQINSLFGFPFVCSKLTLLRDLAELITAPDSVREAAVKVLGQFHFSCSKLKNPSPEQMNSLFTIPLLRSTLATLQGLANTTTVPDSVRNAAVIVLGYVLLFPKFETPSQDQIESLFADPFIQANLTMMKDLGDSKNSSDSVRSAAVDSLGEVLNLTRPSLHIPTMEAIVNTLRDILQNPAAPEAVRSEVINSFLLSRFVLNRQTGEFITPVIESFLGCFQNIIKAGTSGSLHDLSLKAFTVTLPKLLSYFLTSRRNSPSAFDDFFDVPIIGTSFQVLQLLNESGVPKYLDSLRMILSQMFENTVIFPAIVQHKQLTSKVLTKVCGAAGLTFIFDLSNEDNFMFLSLVVSRCAGKSPKFFESKEESKLVGRLKERSADGDPGIKWRASVLLIMTRNYDKDILVNYLSLFKGKNFSFCGYELVLDRDNVFFENAFANEEEFNFDLLFGLLREKSDTELLSGVLTSSSALRRRNLLVILLARSFNHGKPVYLKEHSLYCYVDKAYCQFQLHDRTENEICDDFAAAFLRLTKLAPPTIDSKLFTSFNIPPTRDDEVEKLKQEIQVLKELLSKSPPSASKQIDEKETTLQQKSSPFWADACKHYADGKAAYSQTQFERAASCFEQAKPNYKILCKKADIEPEVKATAERRLKKLKGPLGKYSREVLLSGTAPNSRPQPPTSQSHNTIGGIATFHVPTASDSRANSKKELVETEQKSSGAGKKRNKKKQANRKANNPA